MFMTFDIKFIRHDQKTLKDGMAEPFRLSGQTLINFVSKGIYTWYAIDHAILSDFKPCKLA